MHTLEYFVLMKPYERIGEKSPMGVTAVTFDEVMELGGGDCF